MRGCICPPPPPPPPARRRLAFRRLEAAFGLQPATACMQGRSALWRSTASTLLACADRHHHVPSAPASAAAAACPARRRRQPHAHAASWRHSIPTCWSHSGDLGTLSELVVEAQARPEPSRPAAASVARLASSHANQQPAKSDLHASDLAAHRPCEVHGQEGSQGPCWRQAGAPGEVQVMKIGLGSQRNQTSLLWAAAIAAAGLRRLLTRLLPPPPRGRHMRKMRRQDSISSTCAGLSW